MIILEVNIRKKVTCVFKIFLMHFIHVQYLITEIYVRISSAKSAFQPISDLQLSKFSGEACPGRAKKFSAIKQREFFGVKFVNPITYTIPPSLRFSFFVHFSYLLQIYFIFPQHRKSCADYEQLNWSKSSVI